MKDLLFSFEGRIPRSHYWGGVLVLSVLAFIIALVTVLLFANEGVPFSAKSLVRVNSLIGLCMLYCGAALMTKRVKDRDRPLWLVKLFLIPYGLILVGEIFGITATHDVVDGEFLRTSTTIGNVLEALNLCVMVWALVELGFLRGTRGTNQWGPDPLNSPGS